MLRKLISQDMKNQKRTYILLILISLGCAVVSSISLVIEGLVSYEASSALSAMGLGLVMGLTLLGAFVSPVAIVFSVAIYYYRKIVTDEAYLTFTLPATAKQTLNAKMISGSIWMIIAAAVMIVNAAIISIPSILVYSSDDYTVGALLKDIAVFFILPYSSVANVILGNLAALFSSLATMLSQLALIYLCITYGGILASKHKALVGVALYFGADVLIGGLMEAIMMSFNFEYLVGSYESAMILYYFINALLYGGFTVACHQINKHLLQNKLNLA
ncbi:MAG: hypothetical protein IJX76_00840 [Clostridia bacterium]|nr:hypothetical protein [Clostridia bacterium]